MSPAAEAEMVWLKSMLTGLVAAIVTVVAIVAATATFFMSAGEGSGIGAVTFGVSALLLFPAALAFALAFRWMLRRQQRSLTRPTRLSRPTRPTSPTTPTRMSP